MEEELRTGERKDLLNKDEDPNKRSCLQSCKGIAAAIGSVALVSVSGSCVQLLERRVPDLELNTFRFLTSLVGCSICLLATKQKPVIDRDQTGTTLLYGVVLFFPAIGYFVAISLLPAALTSCITYTVDVFGSLVLLSLFWKEKITSQKVLFAFICMIGVFMVIQPNMWKIKKRYFDLREQTALIQQNTTDSFDHVTDTQYHVIKKIGNISKRLVRDIMPPVGSQRNSSVEAIIQPEAVPPETVLGKLVGYTCAAMAGLAFSCMILITKRNPYINENILQVLFWNFLMNIVISIVLMVALETPVLPSNWFDAVMVAIHSVSAAAVYPLYILAPKYISGNTYSLIFTTEVVFMLASQYTVLSSILPGHRNWMEVVGVVLVLLGCSMSSIMEMFKCKGQNQ